MLIAKAWVAREADVGPDLKRVPAFRPRKIIEEVVDGGLRAVTVDDSLVQTIEHIPRLVRISQNTRALTSEAPVQRVDHCRTQNCRVPNHETFAVIGNRLVRRQSRQEGRLRVVEVLQGATPKQRVPAVGGKVVVEPSDERVIVEAGGRAEAEAGIV